MRWQVLPLGLEQESPGLENRVGGKLKGELSVIYSVSANLFVNTVYSSTLHL